MSCFNNIYKHILELNNLSEYESHADTFEKLFVSLTETNKLYNLTAVTSEEGVCGLHFADSLIAARYPKKNGSMLDIGCGAGFPSLPIAIVRQDLTVNAIDSTAKKIAFSTAFASENGIKNFVSSAARAEELAKTAKRESYDTVTARAVARLNVLSELALPFVKVGGTFMALKGSMGRDEYEEAKKAVKTLGGELERIEERTLVLPSETQSRTIIFIKKVAKTPSAYPRMYSKISKSPL